MNIRLFLLFYLFGCSTLFAQFPMEMVRVEGGQFFMGDTCCYENRKPVRNVEIKSFYIGKYPVTMGQFRKFIQDTDYVTDAEKKEGSTILKGEEWSTPDTINWRHDTKGELERRDDCPVIHVSWNDAKMFCEWLSWKSGKKYRLPTEAEWEYAARGGSKSNMENPFIFSGSNNIDEVGWYSDNTSVERGVEVVGQKAPNQLGIYDMTGNVWEWCHDWYAKQYNPEKNFNPQGPEEGVRRVNRGGSWKTPAAPQSHITHRSSLKPDKQGNLLGFRIVCEE